MRGCVICRYAHRGLLCGDSGENRVGSLDGRGQEAARTGNLARFVAVTRRIDPCQFVASKVLSLVVTCKRSAI